jgi:S1-C subfamily serine protease
MKFASAPLAAILIALSVTAAVVRSYIRSRRPRWNRCIRPLLVSSGLWATLLVAGVLWSCAQFRPMPLDRHLLDNIEEFPDVPSSKILTVEELDHLFKHTVLVVARQPRRGRLSHEELSNVKFGSGVLVFAGRRGYLILSSRDVIDGPDWQTARRFSGRVEVALDGGDFTLARVAGRHRTLDLILLRVKRRHAKADFAQPIRNYSNISPGERIAVFGHPSGLFFSVLSGTVLRREEENLIQITTPVTPSLSGGPVYDLRGRLLGIMNWMAGGQSVLESKNLNVATRADSLFQPEDWVLDKQGRRLLNEFVNASRSRAR